MSESHVTQCPHCRTSFRVSQAQLAAAHGAVRCGACLHVFNAAEQLFGAAARVPKPAAPATSLTPPAAAVPKAAKATDDTLWIHDDLDLDGLDLDEELAKLEEQEQQLSKQFLALEPSPRPSEGFKPADEPRQAAHDEAWAEALLREEANAEHQRKAQARAQEPDEPIVPAFRPAPPAPPAPVSQAPADSIDEEPHEPRLGRLDIETDDPADESPAEPELTATEQEQRPQRSEPNLGRERLFELDDEPLQLDWQPRQGIAWGRVFGWGLLNLVALAGLLAQYAAYNFDELARQDRYRPWFEQLCPNIGCSLPSKVDISQIRSSNLVVRSHPEFSGALVVDAILYNRAPFAQPFPLLEMRFADMGGQLVASRRFKPSEYLAGELAGQSEMPPQTPIHISLDILDPGPRAVNYSLSFHSPE